MKIRFKKLTETASDLVKFHTTDAGFDLTAVSKEMDDLGNAVYGTGIAIELPIGYVGLIFPRSSISKTCLALTNSVGVIDADYRGEIMFKFKPAPYFELRDQDLAYEYEIGDRIGQLIILPIPEIEFELAEELTSTGRGEGGFGSTDVSI